MISASSFLEAGRARGFDFYCGVPCSFLTPLINRVISDPATKYVGATSEGEAVAIAAGAWLAGKETVVICQNSGLGNTVSPLTSLNWPFRIPSLLISTWRGQPGLGDEPQHELMGRIMDRLLDNIEVPYARFPKAPDEIEQRLDQAVAAMDGTGLPFALLMEKGSVEAESLDQPAFSLTPAGHARDLTAGGERPTRFAALERFLERVPESAAVIATTGKCGRELFTLADRPQHLYQVGSMGCASAMGLGLALNTSRPVVVLDGDGAALMKLGNLATVGAQRPANLVHILLDNGVHDSTGGQATVSPGVDFAAVARACGYRSVTACDELSGFTEALEAAFEADDGPVMIHLRIKPGSLENLGRPTVAPRDVARRFREFVLAG